MNVTVQEYQEMLDKHDWWYQMSDDMRSWNRGHEEHQKLEQLAKINPEFALMYELKKDKVFHKPQ